MLQRPRDFTIHSRLNWQELQSHALDAWHEAHAISGMHSRKQQTPQIADYGHHAIDGRQRRSIAGRRTTTLLFHQQGCNLVQCPQLSSDFAHGGVSIRIQGSDLAKCIGTSAGSSAYQAQQLHLLCATQVVHSTQVIQQATTSNCLLSCQSYFFGNL